MHTDAIAKVTFAQSVLGSQLLEFIIVDVNQNRVE